MKTIKVIMLFSLIAVFAEADNWESYQLIDRLLTLPGPGAPVVFEDNIIFTISSELRRAGIAFAHEDFSKVYWFRQLLVPQDRMGAPIPTGRRVPDPYRDSGMLFYVWQIPENIKEIEYRLIINGLWTVDPSNPQIRKDPVSGLNLSVISLPYRNPAPGLLGNPPGSLNFSFRDRLGKLLL